MTQPKKQKFAWSLWIPVILAFVIVIAAWTFLIKLAKDNPVETIEIEQITTP
jgi:cytochrome c-type biogenesis protein CcmH/NrfF